MTLGCASKPKPDPTVSFRLQERIDYPEFTYSCSDTDAFSWVKYWMISENPLGNNFRIANESDNIGFLKAENVIIWSASNPYQTTHIDVQIVVDIFVKNNTAKYSILKYFYHHTPYLTNEEAETVAKSNISSSYNSFKSFLQSK
jgi:hypothetical protein